MSILRGGGTKVIEDIDTHTGRQSGLSALTINLRTDIVNRPGLTATDFVERIPHFRFQPDARTSVRKRDVTTDKSRHKPPSENL